MNFKKFLKQVIKLIPIVLLTTGILTGCGQQNSLTKSNANSNSSQVQSISNSSTSNSSNSTNSNYGGITTDQKSQLANLNYQSGQSAIVNVNNGKSTLNPSSWTENKVIYSNLDSLNRTSNPNTGFLEARNKANESLRVRQTVDPTAWHNNHGQTQIYNRGHMIAYSVSAGISQNGNYDPNSTSGDQNNPKNLFTQTAFSNQKLQTIYETKVRQAIESGKKVIYQVTPIFRGNELMARGVNLQAISTDGQLNFNVYIFNVQPGYTFDYANGNSQVDNSMNVPTPADAPNFNNENNQTNHHKYFSEFQKAKRIIGR